MRETSETTAWKWARAAGSTALVGAVFVFVLPQFASYSEVWESMRTLSVVEIAVLSALTILSWAGSWWLRMEVMPGLTLAQSALSHQASTAAANSLPGGGLFGVGVTYSMYRSWGFTGEDVARSAVVSGVWNNFVKLGMPVLALSLLAFTSSVSPAWITSAVGGVVVLVASAALLVVIVRSESLARAVGELAGRVSSIPLLWFGRGPVEGWGDALASFSGGFRELLQSRWWAISAAAVANQLILFFVLLAALRALDVGNSAVTWVAAFASYSIVRLLSALPITPGGLGVVELGYAATLMIGAPEVIRPDVLAAILLFRFLTYFPPIPIGMAAYAYWRYTSGAKTV